MRKENESKSINAVSEVLTSMDIKFKVDNVQYSYYDINVTGTTNTIGKVEVKYRYIDKFTFVNYWLNKGLVLEETKYNELKDLNSLYLNYFVINNVEIIVAWSLTGKNNCTKHISTKKGVMKAKATTEYDNDKEVDKDVYYLIDQSSILRMVKYNGKWYKLSIEQFNNYIKNRL